jgi:hypothetical protein
MRFLDRAAWATNPIIHAGEGAEFFTYEQLQTRTIESLKAWLRRRIGGYTVALKYPTTMNRFYRGRICTDRPRTVDDVSYPPPDKVKKLGRANRDGEPMFYCCLGAFPVFFEIHAKEGDLIALSEWAVTEPLWMHNLGYHPDALAKMGAPAPPQRSGLISPIPNETNRNYRLRHRMSLAFTQDVPEGAEYRYKETIAINELLFDRAAPILTRVPDGPRTERAAGTVYPTVQMRGLADNAAIWPDFVDRHLRPRSVRYIRVEVADQESLRYTFLTVVYSDKFSYKTIVWNEDQAPEIERRAHVAFEEGRWISRDGFGRIYDVH